jgi:hypothetical protein
MHKKLTIPRRPPALSDNHPISSVLKIPANSKNFSGSVGSGSSFTKACDRRQFNFAGDVAYHTERYSGQLKYSSTLGTANGETDANRQQVTLAGIRYFTGKWLAYSQFSYEHNYYL